MAGVTTAEGLFFSRDVIERVVARNDPKCPRGWEIGYAARVQRDFAGIKPWLPLNGVSVTDIGCGFAGIDVLLVREARFEAVHLIDGNGSGRREGGFHDKLTPWHDVAIAEQIVSENVTCDLGREAVPPPPRPRPADLIISLKSWGHHYAVSAYLDYARRSLNRGGRIILDVRKNTDGCREIDAVGFRLLGRAGGTLKTDRLVFQ